MLLGIFGKETENVEMAESNEDEGIISKVFSAISAIFAPLLPALAGSGILRGLLILAVQLGMIKEGSGTYTIFIFNIYGSVFIFLPVLLAFTSGKKIWCKSLYFSTYWSCFTSSRF